MPDSRATSASSFALAAALACALAFLAGCGHSQKCDFDDRPRDDVWAAVVQTARAPRYSDWIVVENDVKVDEASLQKIWPSRDWVETVVTRKPMRSMLTVLVVLLSFV